MFLRENQLKIKNPYFVKVKRNNRCHWNRNCMPNVLLRERKQIYWFNITIWLLRQDLFKILSYIYPISIFCCTKQRICPQQMKGLQNTTIFSKSLKYSSRTFYYLFTSSRLFYKWKSFFIWYYNKILKLLKTKLLHG